MRALLAALAAFCLAAAALVLPAAAQEAGYRVNAGDLLSIEVLQDPTLNRDVLVTPDGQISFPFAGALPARGRTVAEIEAALSAAIAPNFAAAPNVFVSVRSLRPVVPAAPVTPAPPPTIDIYFLGEVGKPGRAAVAPGTTLLQALAEGGGVTNFAATKRIQLRRTDPATGNQAVYTIDYRALTLGAGLQNDIVLADGDVILVPERRLFE
jgi:polysaccharide biosynthesis/export protein